MLYRGDFAGAREHSGKGATGYDAERCKLWATNTGQNSGVTHRCYLSVALWHLGFPDQALTVNREMVALAPADRASVQPGVCPAPHRLAESTLPAGA